jgi:pimeloyl-ACP methyl ester carboxylesterase
LGGSSSFDGAKASPVSLGQGAPRPAPSTSSAGPRPANPKNEAETDGLFVGADARTYSRDTPLVDIPAVTPTDGSSPKETLIYVNGILTDKDAQARSLQGIADTTGDRVVGIHNATGGAITDLTQCLGDKAGLGRNPAVDTLADTVYGELKSGHPVHLLAHSQGALVTSRALSVSW